MRTGARICIITAGHLATCPRMVKAADALAAAHYRVRVVSTRYVGWAIAADEAVRSTREGCWEWSVVDWHRGSGRWRHFASGVRSRLARAAAASLRPERVPLAVAVRAQSRMYSELVRAALLAPADLIYGGGGALAAPAAAARRAGIPYALDLEDFHSAEQGGAPHEVLANRLAARVERSVLRGARFLTAGSAAIADAYAAAYGVRPRAVNNTFPLPSSEPPRRPADGEGLRLYWFSQTAGPDRGLEEAVRAMGMAGVPGSLTLRGNAAESYVAALRALAVAVAPRLTVVHHGPAAPDTMVELARGFDVGLALEQPTVRNREICLTNKVFTYLLAGLAVACTDTLGQRSLALDVGDGAALYRPGDVPALARALRRWAEDADALARAKAAAWDAARRRWHWEHPEERGALLGAIAAALGGADVQSLGSA